MPRRLQANIDWRIKLSVHVDGSGRICSTWPQFLEMEDCTRCETLWRTGEWSMVGSPKVRKKIEIIRHHAKPFSEEDNEIVKRFAKVFDQSYSRFLDLQKAEAQSLRAAQELVAIKAARKKTGEALTGLKATQAQLIRSETMVSLGKLTACIAMCGVHGQFKRTLYPKKIKLPGHRSVQAAL